MKTKFNDQENDQILAYVCPISFLFLPFVNIKKNSEKLEELSGLIFSHDWKGLFENKMWRDCVKGMLIPTIKNADLVSKDFSALIEYFPEEISSIRAELLKEQEELNGNEQKY